MTPPTYPMRPMNGGLFDSRPNQLRYGDNAEQWRFEPKLNGWRALVNDGTMWNRHGARLSIQGEFDGVLADLAGAPWWDVEALERRHNIGKGSLILLDLIPVGVPPGLQARYLARRDTLESRGAPFDWQEPYLKEDTLYVVPSFDFATALKFWAQAPIINEILGCTFYEGLVAKRVTSEYTVQRRSDQETTAWIKHKFTTLP